MDVPCHTVSADKRTCIGAWALFSQAVLRANVSTRCSILCHLTCIDFPAAINAPCNSPMGKFKISLDMGGFAATLKQSRAGVGIDGRPGEKIF